MQEKYPHSSNSYLLGEYAKLSMEIFVYEQSMYTSSLLISRTSDHFSDVVANEPNHNVRKAMLHQSLNRLHTEIISRMKSPEIIKLKIK